MDGENNEIFYIGKGKGQRMYQHVKDAKRADYCYRSVHRKIQNILTRGHSVKYSKIICDSEQQAFDLEQRLIREIGRKDLRLGPLCNLTDGGEGSSNTNVESVERRAAKHRGMKRSEESKARMKDAQNNLRKEGLVTSQQSRQKMSVARKGRPQSEETKQKRSLSSPKRQIIQLDASYDVIKKWESMSGASRTLNLDLSGIYRSCKRDGNSIVGGFRWKYLNDDKKPCVIVGQYDVTSGQLIQTFNTSIEAAKSVGGDSSSIIYCCNGRTKVCSGYAWKYIPIDKKDKAGLRGVIQIDPITREEISQFPSAYQAAAATNQDPSCVSKCCSGKALTAGGYKWRWEDSERLSTTP